MKSYILNELERYNWNGEEYKVKEYDEFIFLIFKNIKFRFYYNALYDSVNCDLLKADNINQYQIDILELEDVKMITLDQEIYDDQSDVSVQDYISQFVRIINNFLLPVIKGNNTIIDRVLEIRENVRIIQSNFGQDLIFKTEAYIEMIDGNKNWKLFLMSK